MFVCIVGIARVNAQGSSKFKLGIKAGLNYSNIYDVEGEDFVADSKLGVAAGTFVFFPIGDLLGFQPELLLSTKGFRATGFIYGMPYEMTRTTTFLDIPLLFVLRPIPLVSIVGGPQISYLLEQRDVFQASFISYEAEKELENQNIRRNVLSFVGGVDINMGHFVLGTRIGCDVQNNRGDGTSSNPLYKNIWMQATLALRF